MKWPNKANSADAKKRRGSTADVRQDEINIITSFAEIAKTGKSGK